MAPVVLCVAEKPSLASSIANFLSDGTHATRRGSQDVHEFRREFKGQLCDFRVTAVLGHVLTIDFPSKFQSWDLDPGVLFDAPVQKKEASPGARVVEHLEREAKGAAHLILWLDCDREGENICFEVMDACVPVMRPPPGAARDAHVHRAKFSAVTKRSIEDAMRSLGKPNRDEALAVDARQELDLKIGVAFTRFQTRFFQGKYDAFDSSVVSYGPCQTPTLGFAVARHLEIAAHVSEDYWTLEVELMGPAPRPTSDANTGTITTARVRTGHPGVEDSTSAALKTLRPTWARGRVFDGDVGELYRATCAECARAAVVDFAETEETKPRPPGLNTVDMLKAASAGMGLGAHRCMQLAERLYIQGYVSYPRTESTAYPPGFDLRGTLATQTSHPQIGEHARGLLDGGERLRARGGVDAGDHPPITPAAPATESDVGGGDAWRLYDFIARRFVASVSSDCAYVRQRATLDVAGERFAVDGRSVTDPGWTSVMPWRGVEDDPLGPLTPGATIPVSAVRLIPRQTAPPSHLTESELIGLMERHGIGTDASIPTHINNVEKRKYVEVRSGGSRADGSGVDAVARVPRHRPGTRLAHDPIAGGETAGSGRVRRGGARVGGGARPATVCGEVRQLRRRRGSHGRALRGALRSRLGRGANVQQVRPMRPIPHPRRRASETPVLRGGGRDVRTAPGTGQTLQRPRVRRVRLRTPTQRAGRPRLSAVPVLPQPPAVPGRANPGKRRGRVPASARAP